MTFGELEGGELFIKKDDVKFPQALLFRKLIHETGPYKVHFPTLNGKYFGPGDINSIFANGTILTHIPIDEEIIWIK